MTQKKQLRVENAKIRQASYDKLTLKEKIEKHNSVAGPKQGIRQREKLMLALIKQN